MQKYINFKQDGQTFTICGFNSSDYSSKLDFVQAVNAAYFKEKSLFCLVYLSQRSCKNYYTPIQGKF